MTTDQGIESIGRVYRSNAIVALVESWLFPDIAAFQSALLEYEPSAFVSHFMFETVPHAFSGDLTGWIEWKRELADMIEVDPHNIVMTGSAATGFSLNPAKNFRAFHAESDFDCGVVSGWHFDVAWRCLRQNESRWLSESPETRKAVNSHKANFIFAGAIAADRDLALLPFGAEWQKALDRMAALEPTRDREVKLRIYKDFDALRHYQTVGIIKARDRAATMAGPGEIEGEEEIGTEE